MKKTQKRLIVFVLIAVALVLGIPLFANLTGFVVFDNAFEQAPESQETEIQETPFSDDLFSHAEARHWDHMPLTYNYQSCEETFNGRMKEDIENALIFIEEKTEGAVAFVKTDSEETDITFFCDIGLKPRENYLTAFTIAEAESFVYLDSNVYAPGRINIYSTYECLGERPTVIIHEVAHLLGLEHNVRPSYTDDIMHPFIRDNCEADFLEKDIESLKSIYKRG